MNGSEFARLLFDYVDFGSADFGFADFQFNSIPKRFVLPIIKKSHFVNRNIWVTVE